MNEQLLALYELQSVDVKIGQVNARLAAMNGAKDLRRKYSAAKAACEAAEKILTEREGELKDSELKLKSIDEKRGACEKRMYGGAVGNPKELAALEKEIKTLKEQQGKLDPRVLELYDLVEEAGAKAASAREALQSAETKARQAIKRESIEKAKLEAELAELTAHRAEEAGRVTDRALMTRYDSLRKRTGSTGIAKVVKGNCGGCHVAVTPFTLHNLYTTDETQTCENCGRILLAADE